jgi:opacity protein-like surface antigen
MKRQSYAPAAALIVVTLLNALEAPAQQHEVGLMLGRATGQSRRAPAGTLDIGGGTALQANYAYRFARMKNAELWGEAHILATPLQQIDSVNRTATRDYASLYAIPGIRVKFAPRARVAPYAAIGAGYALFEQSLAQIDGSPNPAPRFTHRGALAFGGGLDVRVWRFLSARWEVRDFYSGNPSFNTPVAGKGLHNLVFGGGIGLRLGSGER